VGDELAGVQPREIGDEEYVSQYGSRMTGQPNFWDHPRPEDLDGLSATIGRLTPAEARPLVRRSGSITGDDGVRYALVGDLRGHGFKVSHTPSQRNKDHASISYDSEWDGTMTGKFTECWSDPVWYEERRRSLDE
jgi:hypothetical protein